MENKILFAIERHEEIVKMAQNQDKVLVPELSEYFGVSAATIRKDLNELEKQGKLKRTHGGAVYLTHSGYELKSEQKKIKHIDSKQSIAKAALEFIEDGDIILLDTGTTIYELAKLLHQRNNITVVTNDIECAMLLEDSMSIEVILVGGNLRKGHHCTVGPFANKLLKEINVDIAFIGTNAVDMETGTYTPNPSQSENKTFMLKCADKVILLSDSTKFGKKAFTKFADLNEFDLIITDSRIEEEYIHHLENLHVCPTT